MGETAHTLTAVAPEVSAHPPCTHCGARCPDRKIQIGDLAFCCAGCRMVYELLRDRGLAQFYAIEPTPGIRPADAAVAFEYLDEPVTRRRLLDFSDGRLGRVTFRIPAMHCAACVWLLENLYRLNPAIGVARVHFPRKELSLSFDETRINLSGIVHQLVALGYEPSINLGSLEPPPADTTPRALLLRLGVAGFAFGNIMLLSFPSYLGLDAASDGPLRRFFGMLSILLALPVLLYSASGYWQAAWRCVRGRMLTIEFPIALGIFALFTQSVVEILTGFSEGYLDSFAAGLIFLLLCGQWFQRRTYESLAFDRDYKAYFPLAAMRREGAGLRAVPVTALAVGDRILVRHQELVPADAVVIAGAACMDYSFVTGESAPVGRRSGDYLYAGGRQVGGSVELEVVKPVSQSYLTALWNHEAFRKPRAAQIQNLTNRAGRVFTYAVIAIAAASGLVWLALAPPRALRAFTSVLLVACPCALALTAPFALGSAQRILGRHRLYLRHGSVVEDLGRINTLVFDKTGTLTQTARQTVDFNGASLSDAERAGVAALARQSTHPASRRIAAQLGRATDTLAPSAFEEHPGLGIHGVVSGLTLRLGTLPFVAGPSYAARAAVASPAATPAEAPASGNSPEPVKELADGVAPHQSKLGAGQAAVPPLLKTGAIPRVLGGSGATPTVCAGLFHSFSVTASGPWLSVDGAVRGQFEIGHAYRDDLPALIGRLGDRYRLAVLSGDTPHEEPALRALFGQRAELLFEQTPGDKLAYVRALQMNLQAAVMMVGDGLNDAGALRQSQVGVAVTEDVNLFSPACDAILDASRLTRLADFLDFSRAAVRVVKSGFAISLLYNTIGIGMACSGRLSPLAAAVLMPISSCSVIGLALLGTRWAAWRRGLGWGSA